MIVLVKTFRKWPKKNSDPISKNIFGIFNCDTNFIDKGRGKSMKSHFNFFSPNIFAIFIENLPSAKLKLESAFWRNILLLNRQQLKSFFHHAANRSIVALYLCKTKHNSISHIHRPKHTTQKQKFSWSLVVDRATQTRSRTVEKK